MVLAVVASLVLTPLWLLISYLEWDLVSIDFSLAAENFNKWPWVKGSVALSTLTFLFPFFAAWKCNGNRQAVSGEIAAYALGLLWFPILMLYPGTKALGIISDDALAWAAFPICLIHYFCATQIGHEIQRIDTVERSAEFK